LKYIKKYNGIVIYLQQEGRGIGIANKIAAYSLQDRGLDTVDANHYLGFKDEMREYNAVVDILEDLGIKSVKIMTNNPFKIKQLSELGVRINDRIKTEVPANPYNIRYLKSKKERMNHFLSPRLVSSSKAEATQSASAKSHSTPDIVASSSVEDELKSETNENVTRKGYSSLGKQSVLKAIEAVKQGEVVIVVDDEDRENEGDMIIAAEHATPEKIGFIVRHTSGMLCASVESDTLDRLELPPMVINNQCPKQTAYTVSVDHKDVVTGISAADRALTFRALADPNAQPSDFIRPGHCFPLRYRKGGVLTRAGHTEASLDLARLAGLRPCGVMAEVVNDDGSMKRLDDLKKFSNQHKLILTSVQDIIAYRLELQQKGGDII
jgi:3,4-dihydroxy-2-butanone 4-phosphate synthase